MVQQEGRLADTFTCRPTGWLAKALLALESVWKPEHDSAELLLRNDGGAETGSGV